MRNTTGFLILGGSSSSAVFIPSPSPLTKHAVITYPKQPPNQSKPPLPSYSQTQRPPLLSTVRLDHGRLNYYVRLASKFAEEGKFEDFLMIAETVSSGSGVKASEFAALLDVGRVRKGILRVVESGGDVRSVIRVLEGVEKLEIVSSAAELFDGSVVEAIGGELRRILKCGEVEELVDLMEKLAGFHFPIKGIVEPAEVIRNCVSKRNPNAAIRYASFPNPSDGLFCTVILEFGKNGDLVSALTAFEASKQNLGGVNMYVYRTIIDVCGLCHEHLRSRSIYEELRAQNINPNLYVFNSLMSVNACDLSYTMHIYKHMQNLGVAPNMVSYNILLKSCCLAARADLAQKIYKEVQNLESQGSLKLDVITYNTMVKVFSDARMWHMALGIKEKMLDAGVTPNTCTWSSLISSCAKAGLVDQTFKLFQEMIMSGCVPNSQCFNTLLHVCVKDFQYGRAFRLFDSWKMNSWHMVIGDYSSNKDAIMTNVPQGGTQIAMKVPFKPTVSTYNVLMKACGTNHHHAKALMTEMKTIGLSPDRISWSTLIGVYGSSGAVKNAVQVLKTMRESGVPPDVIAYTAAIKVCVQHKKMMDAFSLFEEMKRYQIQPTMATYNTLLGGRSKYGSLQEVQKCLAIYQDMRKTGYKPNDYYLKELIEEWCEGIIQDNHQSQGQLNSGNRRDLQGPHSFFIEKVAAHLQKGNADTQYVAVDLRRLSKVEARIVVLAVLRMIKENYTPGDRIKDDMFIILMVEEIGAAAEKHNLAVKDTIIKLLRDDLNLEVLSLAPTITNEGDSFAPHPDLDKTLERTGRSTQFTSRSKITAAVHRLMVTKGSLKRWLEKKSNVHRRQVPHTHKRIL